MAETANGSEKRPQSFAEINIYSKKFLLTLAFCVYVGYQIYAGGMPAKDGVNYIAWVVAFYLAAEGYADGKGGQVAGVIKAALGAGVLAAPVLSTPTPPPADPKPAGGTGTPPQ